VGCKTKEDAIEKADKLGGVPCVVTDTVKPIGRGTKERMATLR
jgi:hypothetical protein